MKNYIKFNMNESLQPKIFIIILNFNGQDVLAQCLSSVYQSDYLNFEVVVVDNNSSDGSLEQAMKSFSRVHFIKNSENFGFSKGNNVGIRWALEKFADYVLVLNNDAVIDNDSELATKLADILQNCNGREICYLSRK